MSIPTTRPVFGADVKELATKLKATVQDMQWLYAVTPNEWAEIVNENRNSPVKSIHIEIMTRFWSMHPDKVPLRERPTAQDVFQRLNTGATITRSRFAIMIGNQKTSGVRWITDSGRSQRKVERVLDLLVTHLDAARDTPASQQKARMQWDQMILDIGRARGVEDVFASGTWSPGIANAVKPKPEKKPRNTTATKSAVKGSTKGATKKQS